MDASKLWWDERARCERLMWSTLDGAFRVVPAAKAPTDQNLFCSPIIRLGSGARAPGAYLVDVDVSAEPSDASRYVEQMGLAWSVVMTVLDILGSTMRRVFFSGHKGFHVEIVPECVFSRWPATGWKDAGREGEEFRRHLLTRLRPDFAFTSFNTIKDSVTIDRWYRPSVPLTRQLPWPRVVESTNAFEIDGVRWRSRKQVIVESDHRRDQLPPFDWPRPD